MITKGQNNLHRFFLIDTTVIKLKFSRNSLPGHITVDMFIRYISNFHR